MEVTAGRSIRKTCSNSFEQLRRCASPSVVILLNMMSLILLNLGSLRSSLKVIICFREKSSRNWRFSHSRERICIFAILGPPEAEFPISCNFSASYPLTIVIVEHRSTQCPFIQKWFAPEFTMCGWHWLMFSSSTWRGLPFLNLTKKWTKWRNSEPCYQMEREVLEWSMLLVIIIFIWLLRGWKLLFCFGWYMYIIYCIGERCNRFNATALRKHPDIHDLFIRIRR